MTRGRHDAPDPPDQGPGNGTGETNPAPADLLQMWISGRTTSEAQEPPPSDTPDSPDDPDSAPADVDTENGQDTGAQPVVEEAAMTSDETPSAPQTTPPAPVAAAPPAPADGPPSSTTPPGPSAGNRPPAPSGTAGEKAAQRWWPAAGEPAPPAAADDNEPAASAEAPPADSDAPVEPTAPEEPAKPAAQWWPYAGDSAEPAQETQELEVPPTEEASVAAEPADDGVQDDVESEWSSEDDTAAPEPDDAPQQPLDPREIVAERAGGWASFGAAQTAEDVLEKLSGRDAWSDSATGGPPLDRTSGPLEPAVQPPVEPPAPEPAPVAEEPAEEPEPEPVVEEPATEEPVDEATGSPALDVPATTHWSLDDFESYIRQQGSNELSSWMGGKAAEAPAPETPVAEQPLVEEAPVEEAPAEEALAEEAPADDEEPAAEAPAPEAPVAAAPELSTPPAVVPATEHDPVVPDAPEGAWAEPDVAWEHPVAEEAQEPLFDVPEPAPAADHPAEASGWDPDATEYFDWTVTDEPTDAAATEAAAVPTPSEAPAESVVAPTDEPAPAAANDFTLPPEEPEPTMTAPVVVPEPEPVVPAATAAETPAPETPAEPAVVVPDAGDQLEAETWQDEGGTDDAEHDHQEWFDDQGLRWVSDDGGYTWFSDDGQGWNAEIGEAIEPVGGEHAPATVAPVTDATPAPAEPAPLFRDEVTPQAAPPTEAWPEAPAANPLADEVWPTAAGAATTTPQAPPPSADLWPAATTPEPAAAPVTQQAPAVASPAAAAPTAPAATPAAAAAADTAIPPFVEYKPRGAYRPLLGVLFVAAAILAVVAIFWAVSKGSQTATGIAAGVTGFALAFWWGLLSWTPTIVSLSGSILEVARGQDGERFDLRSPRLVIDVDDDVNSRNWRTTITRPNGTELVIPASAVDPEEFSRIVKHYRGQAHTSS